MCVLQCTLQLAFGPTLYQGLLAAPRWPFILQQHNDSSEEQKKLITTERLSVLDGGYVHEPVCAGARVLGLLPVCGA